MLKTAVLQSLVRQDIWDENHRFSASDYEDFSVDIRGVPVDAAMPQQGTLSFTSEISARDIVTAVKYHKGDAQKFLMAMEDRKFAKMLAGQMEDLVEGYLTNPEGSDLGEFLVEEMANHATFSVNEASVGEDAFLLEGAFSSDVKVSVKGQKIGVRASASYGFTPVPDEMTDPQDYGY